jgi:hypothetical protein
MYVCELCGRVFEKRTSLIIHKGHHKRKNSKAWSQEEVELLKKYYPVMGTKVQELIPRHSKGSITAMANWFGIKARPWKNVGASARTRLTDREMGYLAGFLDGDGSIYVVIVHNEESRLRLGLYVRPFVTFSNTNKDVIEFISKLLKKAGIKHRIVEVLPDGKLRKRTYYFIEITTYRNVYAFLELVYQDLIAKREVAEYMLKLCESRLSAKGSGIPYTKEELEIIKKIREVAAKSSRVAHTPGELEQRIQELNYSVELE